MNNFETYETNDLKNVLRKVHELLSGKHSLDQRTVCYPGSSSDISPSAVFSHVTYLDGSIETVRSLQAKGYHAIHEQYQDHNHQYDLVIEQRSQGKAEAIMKLVKPGGYIISEENYGIPIALEESDQFVFVKNISKNTVTPPIQRTIGAFGNGGTDYFLYKKLCPGEKKKISFLENIKRSIKDSI